MFIILTGFCIAWKSTHLMRLSALSHFSSLKSRSLCVFFWRAGLCVFFFLYLLGQIQPPLMLMGRKGSLTAVKIDWLQCKALQVSEGDESSWCLTKQFLSQWPINKQRSLWNRLALNFLLVLDCNLLWLRTTAIDIYK